MRLTEILRDEARVLWEKIIKHPFVVELYEGTLPLEKFKFYLKQDYNYLIGVTKTFSLLASKSDYEISRMALELAYADATVEMENYINLIKKLGMNIDDIVSEEPAPTNLAYVNFLLSTCCLGTSLDCLVSLLPCFWSYQVIAEHHRDKLLRNPVDIYVNWAKVYLSDDYIKIVDELRGAVDRLWRGEDYGRYVRIFIRASKYEYMFWDMAYRMETWPV